MFHLPGAVSRFRTASVILFVAAAGGCSGRGASEAVVVDESTSAIVRGTPSPEDEDYVVSLTALGGAFCTATLIAPNVAVTALHCVSDFDAFARFLCSSDGELTQLSDGGGEIGQVTAVSRLQIRVGPAPPPGSPPDAGVVRIFSSGSHNICVNDIALLILDKELPAPPRRVRLGPTSRGEYLTVIGYGQDENQQVTVRHRRSGLRAQAVGAWGSYPKDGIAGPRTLVTGEGPCEGDSGGPTFSEATGALVGAYSLSSASGCIGGTVQNVFTQVAPFQDLIREAMEFAGAELLPEVMPEPAGGSGAGGDSGEDGEGGATASGGSVTASGSSSGARAGASTGGNGAIGGTPDGQGGSDPNAASGGSLTGEGSGSRKDPSCTCNIDTLGSSGSSTWLGVASLFAAALVRRRRARL